MIKFLDKSKGDYCYYEVHPYFAKQWKDKKRKAIFNASTALLIDFILVFFVGFLMVNYDSKEERTKARIKAKRKFEEYMEEHREWEKQQKEKEEKEEKKMNHGGTEARGRLGNHE